MAKFNLHADIYLAFDDDDIDDAGSIDVMMSQLAELLQRAGELEACSIIGWREVKGSLVAVLGESHIGMKIVFKNGTEKILDDGGG